MSMKFKTCCICGKSFMGLGNDPYPINKKKDAVCCNKCNACYVNVAKMKNITINDLVQYYKYLEKC